MIVPSKQFFIQKFGRSRGGNLRNRISIDTEKGEKLLKHSIHIAKLAFRKLCKSKLTTKCSDDSQIRIFLNEISRSSKFEKFLGSLQKQYITIGLKKNTDVITDNTDNKSMTDEQIDVYIRHLEDEDNVNSDITTQYDALQVNQNFIRKGQFPAFKGWMYEAYILLLIKTTKSRSLSQNNVNTIITEFEFDEI